jgi:hypothetical protein
MAREALLAHGANQPARHLLALRSLQQAVVFLSPEPFSQEDLDAARRFSRLHSFDLVWLPDLRSEEANRYNALNQPLFYETARAILTGKGSIPPAASLYSLRPATDPHPYFWHSMKWSTLPDALHTLGRQGLMLFDWGMLVMAATLLVAAFLGAVLILLPLGRIPKTSPPYTRLRILLYFTALGLAYLSLEMAVFQRSTLLLGHAVVAAVVVFSVFLIGSGLGSLSAPAGSSRGISLRVFLPIAGGIIFAAVILWPVGTRLWSLAGPIQILSILAALAPLTWAMGRPLPWGLRQLDSHRSAIPWAWGINGFASVVASPLAVLLSVQFSQPVTWTAAALCYLAAFFIARQWENPAS